MKKLIIIIAVALLLTLSACSEESTNTDSFSIISNNVEIWEDSTGEYYIILAVEFINESNKPLHFKKSDFDIIDEDGNLIDTMNAVSSYPSTVISDKMGVYYYAKVSDKISNTDIKLKAVPHIEVGNSKLTNNQLNQLKITGATTGGSLYSYGTIANISSQNLYNNVRIAVIGRTSDNKVVSVMTATIDSIKPHEELEFKAEDCLKQRSLGPDLVTNYQLFAYIDQ